MTPDVRAIDSTLNVRRNRRSSTADRRLRIALVALLFVSMGPLLTRAAEEGALSDPLPARVRRHCPSCQLSASLVHKKSPSFVPPHPESARLESIKRQILIKLGLSSKPQLPADAVPPREVIMETLSRAEETAAVERTTPSSTGAGRRAQQQQQHPASDADSNSVEDDFYGKTSEIIAFAEPGPKLNGQTLAEFSRVQETAPEPSLRVKSAALWLYVRIRAPGKHDPARHKQHLDAGKRSPTLYIFRVVNSQQNVQPNASFDQNWSELVASERITLQHSGWTKVNMTDGVRKWFSTGASDGGTTQRLRLLIDCSGCGTHVEPVLFDTDASGKRRRKRRRRRRRLSPDDDYETLADGPAKRRKQHKKPPHNKHRPFLVIHTDSSASRRLRRRTPLDCSPTTSACCKQRFFVSFRALGWDDWIIAPSGYYANYCRGDCGGGPAGRTPDTFINYHSHVMDELRKLPPGKHRTPPEQSNNGTAVQQQTNHDEHQQLIASLQPCCAPTKFSSMSLIYFGPDMNIIKRDLPKMVVDECGCP